MRMAFATGALSTGIVAAAAATFLIWLASVVAGTDSPWAVAPWLVPLAAIVVGIATYLAELAVHRRQMARMRATGEPWAYRED